MSAPAATTAPSSRRRIWLEVIGFWLVTAISIRLSVATGLSDDWVSVIKSVALVYLPLAWLLWTKRDLDHFGFTLAGWQQSLVLVAVVSVITLVPFWTANHFWETSFLGNRFRWLIELPHAERVELRSAMGMLSLVGAEVLAVALPEEVFYRGYLQTRLDDLFPAKRRILGASVGWALPIASVIFVAGHLAVRPALWQLGIFVPSLIFGWLRLRTGSLLAPVLYHALCNIGMYLLQRSYA